MTPIQQLLLGVGAASKTYVDEVFSPYLYYGTGSAGNQVNNGIDVSGEGGMVWIKPRGSGYHYIVDSARNSGAAILNPNTSDASANNGNLVSSLNSNGFTLGNLANANTNGDYYASWTFRKQEGFLDIVTYTGDNAATHTMSHSLGSIPGMIIIKKTSGGGDWRIWHKDKPDKVFTFTTGQESSGSDYFPAVPTSTQFTVGVNSEVNNNGDSYVAYIFAGGASTAATAKSVDFDGSNDYLSIPDSSDFTVGSNYTAECWFYTDAIGAYGWDGIFGQWEGNNNAAENSWVLEYVGNDLRFYYVDSGGNLGYKSLFTYQSTPKTNGQWNHFAFVVSSGVTKLFLNGMQVVNDFTISYQDGSGSFNIGGNVASGGWFNGKVSNVRIVNGSALYTSGFKPSSTPLTNVTNTKLLCCNDSSQTGSTVTPGTITNNGATASDDSPFDDPAGYIFGSSGDQNIIKCGTYIGQSGADEVYLDWEPQFVMIKCASASEGWPMVDATREWNYPDATSGTNVLFAQSDGAESDYGSWAPTPRGWKLDLNQAEIDQNEQEYIYIAIRRPDGLVAKPADAGTDVFTMDTGSGSSTIPTFDANFAVDMAFNREPSSSMNWSLSARLTGQKTLTPNGTGGEGAGSYAPWDSSSGYGKTRSSTYQAWMWKRGQGFDVVNYRGTQESIRYVPHSLGAVPDMVWIKNRDSTTNWIVGASVLDGGTDPWTHYMYLNSDAAEGDYDFFIDQAPTAQSFAVTTGSVNDVNMNYTALLFKSISGISKVGSYTGNGTSQSITLGFQPRFLILKNGTSTEKWYVLDTLRGWDSGDDAYLSLNTDYAQVSSNIFGEPTATGFDISGSDNWNNANGETFIYYAHA